MAPLDESSGPSNRNKIGYYLRSGGNTPGSAAGCSHDKTCGQELADRLSRLVLRDALPARRWLTPRVHCVEQQHGGALAHLEEWLTDCREWWMHERSRGGVVEADERHVLGYTETSLLGGEKHTGSHIVAGGEDSCRPVG